MNTEFSGSYSVAYIYTWSLFQNILSPVMLNLSLASEIFSENPVFQEPNLDAQPHLRGAWSTI